MTRETKIGLLVGLGFIILFGLILGDRTQTPGDAEGALSVRTPPALPRGGGAAEQLTAFEPPPAEAPVEPAETTQRTGRPPRRDGLDVPPQAEWTVGTPEGLVEQVNPFQVQGLDVAPPASSGQPYTVVAGDSLVKIARKVYGAEGDRQYKRIYEANRDKMPNESTLTLGQVLTIPPLAVAPAPRQEAPTGNRSYQEANLEELPQHLQAPPAARTYTVQRGDRLVSIARKMLQDGSNTAVQRLFQANRNQLASPNSMLSIGMVLVIPQ